MPCSHDACPALPKWRPIIVLRSKSSDPPAMASLVQLGYCDSHKTSTSLATFLGDEGFTKLSKFLREAGRSSPDKSLSTLAWEPISAEEASDLALDQHRTSSAPPDEDLAF